MPEHEVQPAYYVPCVADAQGRLRVVLRRTKDDRTALLMYTALDRLRAGAGDVPWALLTLADLQQVKDETPYDVIYPDLLIPEDQRPVTS